MEESESESEGGHLIVELILNHCRKVNREDRINLIIKILEDI